MTGWGEVTTPLTLFSRLAFSVLVVVVGQFALLFNSWQASRGGDECLKMFQFPPHPQSHRLGKKAIPLTLLTLSDDVVAKYTNVNGDLPVLSEQELIVALHVCNS